MAERLAAAGHEMAARRGNFAGLAKVMAEARAAGAFGAALSGAGPSVIALCSPSRAAAVASGMKNKWKQFNIASRTFTLDFDSRGARITV